MTERGDLAELVIKHNTYYDFPPPFINNFVGAENNNPKTHILDVFKMHVVWGYVAVIQSQNLLVCLDRFLAIFCPFWYKDTMTPSLAYLSSFVAVVVVTTPWTLLVIMGWISHPSPIAGNNCYLEITQNYWRGIQIFGTLSIAIPGSLSTALGAAVFYHRKRGSASNRKF